MAVKEDVYEYLKGIEGKAKIDIKNNYIGYENYTVKTVKHFDKDVELINRKTKKMEKYDLSIVELQNPKKPDEIRVLYYLNGEEVNYADLLIEYETDEPIRDVINVSKANKEESEKDKDKVKKFQMQDLRELELQKKKEEEKKDKKKKEQKEQKEELRKPKYIIQTVDLDEAYSDNVETIHRAFRLPPNVKKLAFAYPNKEDRRELGSGATIYMLDDHNNIVGNAKEYFRIDNSTGRNPMHDDNTEIEVDKTGERHTGKTMRRFQSTKRPDQHLSIKQTEVGQYPEVYADREKETQNTYIGNQVNTRNTSIQASLDIQRINSTYRGVFNPDDIDKEVDGHEKHGDDIENTSKENLDGREDTKAPCEKNIYFLYECLAELKEDDYIRENFSDDEIIEGLMNTIDNNPGIRREELIQKTRKSYISQEQETEMYREGPWASTKH